MALQSVVRSRTLFRWHTHTLRERDLSQFSIVIPTQICRELRAPQTFCTHTDEARARTPDERRRSKKKMPQTAENLLYVYIRGLLSIRMALRHSICVSFFPFYFVFLNNSSTSTQLNGFIRTQTNNGMEWSSFSVSQWFSSLCKTKNGESNGNQFCCKRQTLKMAATHRRQTMDFKFSATGIGSGLAKLRNMMKQRW